MNPVSYTHLDVYKRQDNDFVRISVSDTGCGISPENCAIVFERLAQVKGTTRASRSGLGLGLYISRDLVSRQGGRIWVESQLGHGSTFYLTLPVSVSYTHLDVYKRQVQPYGSLDRTQVYRNESYETRL